MAKELTQETIDLLLGDAVYAVLCASREVEKIYQSSDFGVNLKSKSTPLTKADLISDNEIRARLMHTYIPLLSEEGRTILYEERVNWSLFWLVDPVDGTKEFIKKNGEFTVNVALIENGKPIIGVISVPAIKKLYFAAEGVGSYRMDLKDSDAALSREACSVEQLVKAREITGTVKRLPIEELRPARFSIVYSRSHLSPEMDGYLQEVRKAHPDMEEPKPYGSSLKFCLVAEGSADLYPRITPTSEWDTAAGQAICVYADAEVIDKEKGTPLTYNTESMENPAFLARRKRN